MMQHPFRFLVIFSLTTFTCANGMAAEETAQLLRTIKAVGEKGEGHVAATRAQRELSQLDAAALPDVLRAFEGAGPLASNWLRGAVETIADREIEQGGQLPLTALEKFIGDRKQVPRARRLAFELLERVAAGRVEKLVPAMIDDPSPELRREAVARLIDEADQLLAGGHKRQAAEVYDQALAGAVENDQVKAIVEPLKKLGREVDLPRHFGFITRWSIIGPFNNHEGVGFAAVYPPEKEIDFDAEYKGQLGDVKWQTVETEDDYGVINIAKQLENYKGSVLYAAADFYADGARTVEIRLGTPNAWKLWVNGELQFAREEYHRGTKLDQYRIAAIELKPGRNTILFKICQNEQDQSWAQRYQFQLRVCDSTGSGVLSENRLSTSLSPREAEQSASAR